MEYTPFIDNKGQKIALEHLRYKDILKIAENGIEEGYKIEFKSQWDENFKKKHLCQTIASFANSEGGWLLVGLEDSTGEYVGIDKQRADFSQVISQKLVSVTPMPKFDCRFIHETNNLKRGVLVIKIFEGHNPPYVCNGTIYTRSGSSKIPIKSDRSSIDELINKRIRLEKTRKEFCVNHFVADNNKFPFCAIYFFDYQGNIDYANYDDHIESINNHLKNKVTNNRVYDSIDSVIRMGSDVIGADTITSMEEYFLDDNIKIFMPLFKIDNSRVSSWIDLVSQYNKNVDMNEMIIVDGVITYISLHRLLKSAFEYIKKIGKSISDYDIIFEYKNVKNIVFYHKNNLEKADTKEKLLKDIIEGRFNICYLSEVTAEPLAFQTNVVDEDLEEYVKQLLDIRFLRLFGLNPDSFRDIMEMSEGKYLDAIFSSHDYIEK